MITFERRPCKIGTSINTRRELHGEETVPAMDIPIKNVPLQRNEFNQVMGSEYAWRSFFNESASELDQPMFPNMKSISLKQKFIDSHIILKVGLNDVTIALVNANLAKIKLTPMPGGATFMDLTIQCTPNMEDATALLNFLDHDVDIAITLGQREEKNDNQQELALNVEPSKSLSEAIADDDAEQRVAERNAKSKSTRKSKSSDKRDSLN